MEGVQPGEPQSNPIQMVRLPSSIRRTPPRTACLATLGLRQNLISSQGGSSPLAVSKALLVMRNWPITSATSLASGRGLQFQSMVWWNYMSSLVTSSTINTTYVFQLDVPSALPSLDWSTPLLRCVLLVKTSCLLLASPERACTHLRSKLVLQTIRTWNSWASLVSPCVAEA